VAFSWVGKRWCSSQMFLYSRLNSCTVHSHFRMKSISVNKCRIPKSQGPLERTWRTRWSKFTGSFLSVSVKLTIESDCASRGALAIQGGLIRTIPRNWSRKLLRISPYSECIQDTVEISSAFENPNRFPDTIFNPVRCLSPSPDSRNLQIRSNAS
jgi:hypothetical protein